MGKWGMSDDEEEEEVVEEQQPEEQQQEEQPQQQVEDAAEETHASAYPSPARRLTGYATGIQFSFTETDFGRFLNDSNVQYQKIEYELNELNNKFNGKAKVFFDDNSSLDNFLKLNETDINGVMLRTKIWEKRGGRPDRGGRGGRGGRDNDRGDRRGGDRRGERDNYRDQRDNYRDQRDNFRDRERDGGDYRSAPRRNVGTSDARNLGDEEFGGRGGGLRREPSTRSNKSDKDAPLPSPPAPAASRPKLNIQPRTLPVETIGKLPGASPSSSSIFGAGKAALDVFTFEALKSTREPSSTEPPAAPTTTEVAQATEEVAKLSIAVDATVTAVHAGPGTASSTVSTSGAGETLDGLIDQPPSASSTTSKTRRNNNNNNNNNKDKKRQEHVKHAPSQEESSQPDKEKKQNGKKEGEVTTPTTATEEQGKRFGDKKYKDNKGKKEFKNKKEVVGKQPSAEEAAAAAAVPKVEEEAIPSDFKVIASKSKAKATAPTTTITATATVTTNTSKPVVAMKTAFSVFDDDSD